MHGKVRQQLVAWSKGEVARLEQAGSTFADDGLSRNIKVMDHGIGFPMAQKLDDIGIDIGAEESCGTPTPPPTPPALSNWALTSSGVMSS